MERIDKVTFSTPETDDSVTVTVDEFQRTIEELPTLEDEKYSLAPEVEAVANRLISSVAQFEHLADARIAYLFRNTKLAADWMNKGKVVMGRAYVHNERQKLLTDYDLQIVVNKRVWELANATQREALVAHELCHFEPKEPDKFGNPRWGLANHDLEEFSFVVRKYGIWDESLRRFMAAYEEGQIERNQLRLFSEEDEDLEGESA